MYHQPPPRLKTRRKAPTAPAAYTLILKEDHEALVNTVNDYLRDGWEPQGGPTKYGAKWSQAMIRHV